MLFLKIIGMLLVSIVLFFAAVGAQLSYHIVKNDGNVIVMWIDGALYIKPFEMYPKDSP